MSAKAEALRFQGAPSGRGHWYLLLVGTLVAVAVAGTLAVLSSLDSGTTVGRVPPRTVTHANGAAVAPATSVMTVGGTSAYRYHPLPGVNTVFELAAPAAAPGAAQSAAKAVIVGGTSVYRYHQLP
jgi:hypothetical protein